MKISSRLAITYSTITSISFSLFAIFILLLSSIHDKTAFESRLKERVVITEKVFLEKESFTSMEFEKITNDFLHTLDNETEEVINLSTNEAPQFQYSYPDNIKAKLLSNESFTFSYDSIQGASSVFNINNNRYLVIVTAVDSTAIQNQAFLKNRIILMILLAIPMIFIISFYISKRSLLPISKKVDKANLISASNLHMRLIVENPNDELGKMAIAFNNVLDRLESSFDAQKSFISNASHEIKNPLTAIMGEAEVAISKERTSTEYQETLQKILNETESIDSTISNLLQLSKVHSEDNDIKLEAIVISEFITEVKQAFDFINPQNKIKIVDESIPESSSFEINGNKQLLKTAILNVFDNACKFSENQLVVVTIENDDNFVKLTIKDQGIGIEKNEIEDASEFKSDFEFNQDIDMDFEGEYRSPGWERFKKNKMLKWKK